MDHLNDLLRSKNSLFMGGDAWERAKRSPECFRDGIIAIDHFADVDGNLEIAEFIVAEAGSNNQISPEYQLSLLVNCEPDKTLDVDFGAGSFTRPGLPGQFMLADNEKSQSLRGVGPFHSISLAIKKKKAHEFFDELFGIGRLDLTPLYAHSFRDNDLAVMIKALMEAYRQNKAAGEAIDIQGKLRCLCRRLGLLAKATAENTQPNRHVIPESIQLSIDYMRTHLTRDIPVEELATAAGLSPGHFRRLFPEVIGLSPKKYQMDLRMELAKSMLRNSPIETPIASIAEACGFASRGHLYREFQKTLAVSPDLYRKLS